MGFSFDHRKEVTTSVKYMVIYHHKEKYSIYEMYRILEVSRSGYYDYVKRMGKFARLFDLLGVSADELIGCKSMTQRPTATEWTTLQKYRALDEHGKEVVDYLIDSEY